MIHWIATRLGAYSVPRTTAVMQRIKDGLDGKPRLSCQLCGQSDRPVFEFFNRPDLACQPDRECLRTGDLPCSENHVERMVSADTIRKSSTATPRWRRTQIHLGKADLRALRGCQPERASERQFESTSRAIAEQRCGRRPPIGSQASRARETR